MTPKQSRFVDEYLIDLNATQAAIRAGFSAKSAHVTASRLLSNAKIAAAVASAMTSRSKRTLIEADAVLAELARIGFSDMRKFATWGPSGVSLLNSAGLDEDSARCVAEVSETTSKDGGSIKFKLHDKPSALVSLGKHLGLFQDGAAPVNVTFVVQTPPKHTDRTQWQRQYATN